MFDPNDPAAYLWPADFAKAWVADYDREHQRELPDPCPAFIPRFITGISSLESLDGETIRAVDVIWQIPEPMTITTREIDSELAELLELLFGQPVVPLCRHQIPSKGTE